MSVSRLVVVALFSLLIAHTALVAKMSPPQTPPSSSLNAQISQVAQAEVAKRYSNLKPTWFDTLITTGTCDHLGQRHPDWNICMANLATWTNRKQNPQLFGQVSGMHLSLLQNVSAQATTVNVQGATATAVVTVTGTCTFTDEINSCVNVSVDMPNRPFRTQVRVSLSNSTNRQWQVVGVTEDAQAAQARKQALDADIAKIRERAQRGRNQLQVNQQLIKAVDDRNQAAALAALQQGADPNATIESSGMRNKVRPTLISNDNSLHLAIWHKDLGMTQLLLEHGANPNQRGPRNTSAFSGGNSANYTPLRQVIFEPSRQESKLALIALLISKGADPNMDGALQTVESRANDPGLDPATRQSYRELVSAMAKRSQQPVTTQITKTDKRPNREILPECGPLAKQARITTPVIAEVAINQLGIVTNARIISGHPLVNAQVIEALTQWVYSPQAGALTNRIEMQMTCGGTQ